MQTGNYVFHRPQCVSKKQLLSVYALYLTEEQTTLQHCSLCLRPNIYVCFNKYQSCALRRALAVKKKGNRDRVRHGPCPSRDPIVAKIQDENRINDMLTSTDLQRITYLKERILNGLETSHLLNRAWPNNGHRLQLDAVGLDRIVLKCNRDIGHAIAPEVVASVQAGKEPSTRRLCD